MGRVSSGLRAGSRYVGDVTKVEGLGLYPKPKPLYIVSATSHTP